VKSPSHSGVAGGPWSCKTPEVAGKALGIGHLLQGAELFDAEPRATHDGFFVGMRHDGLELALARNEEGPFLLPDEPLLPRERHSSMPDAGSKRQVVPADLFAQFPSRGFLE
jgi:hypothetical protein